MLLPAVPGDFIGVPAAGAISCRVRAYDHPISGPGVIDFKPVHQQKIRAGHFEFPARDRMIFVRCIERQMNVWIAPVHFYDRTFKLYRMLDIVIRGYLVVRQNEVWRKEKAHAEKKYSALDLR
jgi:hypothetical protein